jgi:hypothetical protein
MNRSFIIGVLVVILGLVVALVYRESTVARAVTAS